MKKMEDYDFQNFFEVIGIEKYDDVEYLKDEMKKLEQRCRDVIIKLPSSIIRDDDTLEKEYEQFNKDIAPFNKEVSDYDALDYISQIVKLKYAISTFDKDASNEEKNLSILANRQLRTPEKIEKYIRKKLIPLKQIDCENRNLNSLKDSIKDCICGLKKYEKPQLILMHKTEDGEMVKVYETGTFAYKSLRRPNGTYVKGNEGYSILTVLRDDGNGNLKTYNGVMYLNDPIKNDPDFYSNVVFSDLNMRNAMDNNYGYIGSVCVHNGERYLEYNGIDISELISALYTASTKKERTISKDIYGNTNKTLSDFYAETNELIKFEERVNLER